MQIVHILGEKGRRVVTIAASASLSDAAQLLARERIGAVVVQNPDGTLSGILSERDVTRAVAQDGAAALAKLVSLYMTERVTTCSENDSIDGLMEMMTHHRFRHVPVVEDGRLVGIISIGDVVKSRIEETVREAANLRDYIATG